MKLRNAMIWIAVVIGLVGMFFVYPILDHFLFGVQFCRRVRAELSKETHESFTNRMAQVQQGMGTGQLVRLIGVPAECTVSNETEIMAYRWRGATVINRFLVTASGREYTCRFVCRSGVVQTIEQSEGSWCEGAVR